MEYCFPQPHGPANQDLFRLLVLEDLTQPGNYAEPHQLPPLRGLRACSTYDEAFVPAAYAVSLSLSSKYMKALSYFVNNQDLPRGNTHARRSIRSECQDSKFR